MSVGSLQVDVRADLRVQTPKEPRSNFGHLDEEQREDRNDRGGEGDDSRVSFLQGFLFFGKRYRERNRTLFVGVRLSTERGR